MYTLDVAALLVGGIAIFAWLLLYGFTSTWWRNPIGRLLIGQGLVIGAAYVKSLTQLFSGGPIQVTTVNVSVNVLAAAYLVVQCVVFAHVIRNGRNGESK